MGRALSGSYGAEDAKFSLGYRLTPEEIARSALMTSDLPFEVKMDS
jgi:hypothetical protein